jgi:hypothetical protein
MFKIEASEFRPCTRWTVDAGYTLEFTVTGNLEFTDPFGILVWESNTGGTGANKVAMQADGNLVIYRESQPLWATNTERNPGAALVILNSGDISIRSPDGRQLWSAVSLVADAAVEGQEVAG